MISLLSGINIVSIYVLLLNRPYLTDNYFQMIETDCILFHTSRSVEQLKKPLSHSESYLHEHSGVRKPVGNLSEGLQGRSAKSSRKSQQITAGHPKKCRPLG